MGSVGLKDHPQTEGTSSYLSNGETSSLSGEDPLRLSQSLHRVHIRVEALHVALHSLTQFQAIGTDVNPARIENVKLDRLLGPARGHHEYLRVGEGSDELQDRIALRLSLQADVKRV